MILIIIFWISVLLILHSYLLYPLIVQLLARNRKENQQVFKSDKDLPHISILMSLHNEESVISEKLNSIYNSSYPPEKLEVLIASDASTDSTNEICYAWSEKKSNMHFFHSEERKGKPCMINSLEEKANGEVLIITDANVIFKEKTLINLVKHFKNKEIGLVDTIMTHSGLDKKGIALQENAYINREVRIKQYESRLFGAMMGPFGGCYAVRKNLFNKIPTNFLVDDFYINMAVIEKGKKSINSGDSFVVEDVSHSLYDEFRRKIRIAAGNFQNLKRFSHLAFGIWTGAGFAFFSHKVLRWFGPFFLIAAFTTNLFLLDIPFYQVTFAVQMVLVLLLVIDLLIIKMNLNFFTFRLLTHFFSMNMALLIGLLKYLSGVKSGIWQPTRRKQGD